MAKQIANYLNYVYIDTGAMYRAVALYAIENGMIKDNYVLRDDLINALDKINIRFSYNSSTQKS
jgi:cytidylate kinase